MLTFVIWLVCATPRQALPQQMTAPVRAYADVVIAVTGERLTVVEVRRGRFDKPTALPRFRGRFAVRALAGNKILEEVHVDLPLLADAETDDASDDARRFAAQLRKGVSVKARVRVPLPEGADALSIVDAHTARVTRVPLSAAMEPSPMPAAPAGAPPAR